MRIPGISTAVFAVSIIALSAPALAQVVTPAVEPRAAEDLNTWMSLSYAHLFETDLDGTPVIRKVGDIEKLLEDECILVRSRDEDGSLPDTLLPGEFGGPEFAFRWVV